VLPLATLALIAVALRRGAPAVGLALLVCGLGLQLVPMLRLAAASRGGVGGHAEWVRETSTRRRLRESPLWLVGTALALAGAVVSFRP
jgi:hypothetical protein